MVRTRVTRRGFLGALGVAGIAGCTGLFDDTGTYDRPSDVQGAIPYETAVDHDLSAWDRLDREWSAPTTSPLQSAVDYTVLVENLDVAWDLSFAPTGEVFVTERTGSIVRFEEFEGGSGETVAEPSAVVDAGSVDPGTDEQSWWVEGGEGGLLGNAVHPTYPDPPLVYAYFTTKVDDDERRNTVAAFDVSADDPSQTFWPIVEGIPGDTIHNGGRLEFGPANYLWITTGDGGDSNVAQDLGSLGGKVLRVEPDGSAAPDNPDLGDDADPRIYTAGHRNVQGISWLPDATPVVTEHGPNGGDEVNVLRPGANYGWPNARNSGDFGDYDGTDYQPPVADATSWAPSGSVFYTGDSVPQWRNRFVFGGLIGQRINVTTITPAGDPLAPAEGGDRHDADWMDPDYTATTHPTFEDVLGRVRHVEQGPDGDLYAITSNRDGRSDDEFPLARDDVLVRLEPAD
jgi:glucose/arabinose dehydrogenase